jgi:hypothetical protein
MARPRKWHRCSSGFKYDMNGNGVSPFFIGAAAAEFLPADPQVWFDAASAAGMTATFDLAKVVDKDAESFLQGWLYATPGGQEALAAWLKQRGYGREASGAN